MALAAASASAAVAVIAVADSTGLLVGRMVRGSIRWFASLPPIRQRLRDTELVASAPIPRRIVVAVSSHGSTISTVVSGSEDRTSPPADTTVASTALDGEVARPPFGDPSKVDPRAGRPCEHGALYRPHGLGNVLCHGIVVTIGNGGEGSVVAPGIDGAADACVDQPARDRTGVRGDLKDSCHVGRDGHSGRCTIVDPGQFALRQKPAA